MKKQDLDGTSTSGSSEPRYSMKSDALAWLQEFYEDGALLSQFSGYIKFRLIVDANVILKDLRWLVKNRRSESARTNLLELLEARAIDVFAPTFLSHEVSERISTIAVEQGLDEAAMRMHWQRYQAMIEFVDVGAPPEDDGTYIDNKDVPYLELQRRLGAPIVTGDRHIEQMGGHAVPTSITLTMRTYARASSTRLSLEVAGAVSINVSVKALGEIARHVHRLTAPTISKVPKHAWTVLIGLCCIALLHPSSRKWLSANLTTILDKTANAAAGIMPILVALQAEHSEARAIGDTVFAKLQDELGTRIQQKIQT